MVTYYVVQSFQRGKKGMLIPDQPKQARDESHCGLMAERLALTSASVVAFSRSGCPDTGDWGDAKIISQFGEVPSELLEMTA
ncbi:Hypothetical protein NGAL_HAMBI1146_58420 [Neorhizobium galegae bv. officinalis]|nr:Hypothetical protein NGAL_HAMBI1146_58420 [Neorhizobium galegae bv. officinalis]